MGLLANIPNSVRYDGKNRNGRSLLCSLAMNADEEGCNWGMQPSSIRQSTSSDQIALIQHKYLEYGS